MAKLKPKKKPLDQSGAETMNLAINGRSLFGKKRGGKWEWVCADYPDLARQHQGCESAAEIIGEFSKRAISEVIISGRFVYIETVG